MESQDAIFISYFSAHKYILSAKAGSFIEYHTCSLVEMLLTILSTPSGVSPQAPVSLKALDEFLLL